MNEVNECYVAASLHKTPKRSTKELEGVFLPPRKRLVPKRKRIDEQLGDLNLDNNVSTGSLRCDESPPFPILPSHDANYALQQGGPLKRIKLKPRRSSLLLE
jgi:hypothetical protein